MNGILYSTSFLGILLRVLSFFFSVRITAERLGGSFLRLLLKAIVSRMDKTSFVRSSILDSFDSFPATSKPRRGGIVACLPSCRFRSSGAGMWGSW